MVKRWLGMLCAFGLLLGLTGCASQQVDLVGEWVYENPSGDGAARISIQRDGAFAISGWPNNLQIGGRDKTLRENDLNWEERLSFSGKLDDTEAKLYSVGVDFWASNEEQRFFFLGYPGRECDYVVFQCKEKLYFYLGPQDEGVSTASFFRETE
ncbi:hypothetical protein G7067_06245 [Leucobacter insecticola]|uniref:Lipoprotein n=1 Tax=Leucobacter insecticola TaxID=2714934 RepID=A0A6G8FII5_9MICO|nr:hypothetical protein [Leucobacter insecticola]QIM16113.1 hypothetical protein G7067_06245 [Leucobacter insecticola]